MTNFDMENYIEQTSKTAVYPGADNNDYHGIIYASLGLADEAYELFEATEPEKIKAELGDLLYYFARVIKEFRIDSDALKQEAEDMSEQMKVLSMKEALHQVLSSACKINGHTKKHIRDEDFWVYSLSKEKKIKVQFELSCLYNGLQNICKMLNVSLVDIAEMNLDKLFSRKKRGVLQGSGDER